MKFIFNKQALTKQLALKIPIINAKREVVKWKDIPQKATSKPGIIILGEQQPNSHLVLLDIDIHLKDSNKRYIPEAIQMNIKKFEGCNQEQKISMWKSILNHLDDEIEPTLIVVSSSGGLHLVYRTTDKITTRTGARGYEVANSKFRFNEITGIDILSTTTRGTPSKLFNYWFKPYGYSIINYLEPALISQERLDEIIHSFVIKEKSLQGKMKKHGIQRNGHPLTKIPDFMSAYNMTFNRIKCFTSPERDRSTRSIQFYERTGTFYCFRCHAAFDIIGLFALHRGYISTCKETSHIPNKMAVIQEFRKLYPKILKFDSSDIAKIDNLLISSVEITKIIPASSKTKLEYLFEMENRFVVVTERQLQSKTEMVFAIQSLFRMEWNFPTKKEKLRAISLANIMNLAWGAKNSMFAWDLPGSEDISYSNLKLALTSPIVVDSRQMFRQIHHSFKASEIAILFHDVKKQAYYWHINPKAVKSLDLTIGDINKYLSWLKREEIVISTQRLRFDKWRCNVHAIDISKIDGFDGQDYIEAEFDEMDNDLEGF